MTIRRIQFRGNKVACGKYLPFAKSQLKHLSRTYANRRNWTWERVFSGVKITLEQNGPVQWIKIYSLNGYEFSTNISVTTFVGIDPELYDHADFSVVGKGQIDDPEEVDDPPSLPKIDGLICRNRNGTRLTPENADNSTLLNESIDNRDRWLYGGRYGTKGTVGNPEQDPGEELLGYFLWPVHDWFEITVPTDDEVGDQLVLDWANDVFQAKRKRVMMWWSWRPRHLDLGTWKPNLGPPIVPPGVNFTISKAGNSRLSGSTVYQSSSVFRGHDYGQFPKGGGSARQGKFIVAASWRGDDFTFEARDEKYEQYFSGSTFFSFTPPAWVSGEVMTHWYWRGDGKKCVSLQYGRVDSEDDDETVDAGFVEADLVLYPEVEQEGQGPTIDTELSGFANSQHNLMSLGIMPIAIDYVMHDQRKKRAYYLKHYYGPSRLGETDTEAEPPTNRYFRDVLIYLVSAIIDDVFPGVEEWRIPVWHDTLWEGPDVANIEGQLAVPAAGEGITNTAGAALHPYRSIHAVIAAKDVRADAIAINYRAMMSDTHTVDGDTLKEAPHFGKWWKIWGTQRQNTWIRPDTAAASGTMEEPDYPWFDADPSVWEDADPPEPDPTLPPGDFFNYLAAVPGGYTLLTTGSAVWDDKLPTSLQQIWSIICQQMPWLGMGPGQFSPFRNYNNFTISPTKSFGVAVEVRSNFRYVNENLTHEDYHFSVPYAWSRTDYVEKNYGRGDFDAEGEEVEEGTGVVEVLTDTHANLYNESRGTEWDFLVVPEETLEGDDLFNSANEMGIWVE